MIAVLTAAVITRTLGGASVYLATNPTPNPNTSGGKKINAETFGSHQTTIPSAATIRGPTSICFWSSNAIPPASRKTKRYRVPGQLEPVRQFWRAIPTRRVGAAPLRRGVNANPRQLRRGHRRCLSSGSRWTRVWSKRQLRSSVTLKSTRPFRRADAHDEQVSARSNVDRHAYRLPGPALIRVGGPTNARDAALERLVLPAVTSTTAEKLHA